MEKDPTEVIRKAVLRMLPRNKLRDVCKPFLRSACILFIKLLIHFIACFVLYP
jgi:Ribosomal protein L13